MFNTIFPNIHKEGYKFLAIAIIATFIILLFSKFLGAIFILITVWIYYFFRDPENATQAKEKIAKKLEEMLVEQASMNMENQVESSIVMERDEFFQSQPKRKKTTLSNTRAEIMKSSIQDNQDSPRMEAYNFLKEYSSSPVMEEDEDVLLLWKGMSQSTKRIEKAAAKLAEYYLTPPPSSVDVERLFSTAGDIITNERNRLLPENAAKVLFLRENLPRVNYDY